MLRWSILLVTFALWVGCLAIVYFQCKPVPMIGAEATARATLDRMFAENAIDRRAWNIYVDPAAANSAQALLALGGQLKSTPAPTHARKEWTGMDERGLALAGHLETLVKNKHETSLDEQTTLTLDPPGMPLHAVYAGTAHVTFDNGLEQCKMKLNLKYDALEIDTLSSGVREGNILSMSTSVYHNGQALYSGRRDEPIGGNTALNVELAPFQYNPTVKPGYEWKIAMIDIDQILHGDMQTLKTLSVKCIGDTTIKLKGKPARAYEVRSTDGSARAWYSTDGVVLKQAFQLAGVLEVVFVRDE